MSRIHTYQRFKNVRYASQGGGEAEERRVMKKYIAEEMALNIWIANGSRWLRSKG